MHAAVALAERRLRRPPPVVHLRFQLGAERSIATGASAALAVAARPTCRSRRARQTRQAASSAGRYPPRLLHAGLDRRPAARTAVEPVNQSQVGPRLDAAASGKSSVHKRDDDSNAARASFGRPAA